MAKNYFAIALFSIIAFVFLSVPFANAGFGITPPYVKSKSLTKNSIYQQTIYLVRSDPVNDLTVDVFIDVPGINDWFTVEPGMQFPMPQGAVKVPMTVTVRVPDDAEFENYRGTIRVRTSGGAEGGAVSIALGAQIDVDLTVIDKEILEFRVRKIEISDLNEGHAVGWLYFPGKIRFGMTLENTGNTAVAPSKVEFDIYDARGQQLLEQTVNTNKITKVAPFETKDVVAELPTKLGPGSYIARYRIYNQDEVTQDGEINLGIVPHGTVAAAGYGFFGLSTAHKATIIAPIALVLLILIGIVGRSGSKRRKKRA